MKKFLALLIAFSLVALTTGCPGEKKKDTKKDTKVADTKKETKETKETKDKPNGEKKEVTLTVEAVEIDAPAKDKEGKAELVVGVARKGAVEEVVVTISGLDKAKAKADATEMKVAKGDKEAKFNITLLKGAKEGDTHKIKVNAKAGDVEAKEVETTIKVKKKADE